MTNAISCHLNVLVPAVDDPGVPRALDVIAASGCTLVGLPPFAPGGVDVTSLARALAASGLEPIVSTVQRTDSDVSSADAAVRDAGREAIRGAIRLARELGGTHVTGLPYAAYGLQEEWNEDARMRSSAAVGELADEAAEAGVRLTFEVLNRFECSAINTSADAVRYREAAASDALAIHLDTFHMMIEEDDSAGAISGALPHLGFLEIGQSARGALGRGSVDVTGLVRHAVAAGYDGPIGFEAFSRKALPAQMADRLRVWRSPFDDADAVVAEAVAAIRAGIEAGRAATSGAAR